MTTALVLVAMLACCVAVWCWGMAVRWRHTAEAWQALAEEHKRDVDFHSELRLARQEEVLRLHVEKFAVGDALAKVWHHVTPDTAEEGDAVAVLRDAFPELPAPRERRRARTWRESCAGSVLGDGCLLAWPHAGDCEAPASRIGPTPPPPGPALKKDGEP
jgi:hypothetical protein